MGDEAIVQIPDFPKTIDKLMTHRLVYPAGDTRMMPWLSERGEREVKEWVGFCLPLATGNIAGSRSVARPRLSQHAGHGLVASAHGLPRHGARTSACQELAGDMHNVAHPQGAAEPEELLVGTGRGDGLACRHAGSRSVRGWCGRSCDRLIHEVRFERGRSKSPARFLAGIRVRCPAVLPLQGRRSN
jgi:hypothetical protein